MYGLARYLTETLTFTIRKVAINGLGRIGRATLRLLLNTPELELLAANDLIPIGNLAYLIRYDTVYGRCDKTIEVQGNDARLRCRDQEDCGNYSVGRRLYY